MALKKWNGIKKNEKKMSNDAHSIIKNLNRFLSFVSQIVINKFRYQLSRKKVRNKGERMLKQKNSQRMDELRIT